MTAIADSGTEAAVALLVGTLTHADPVVRGHAALALGARRDTRAIPELIGMVVAGAHDVEAAETLGALARDHDLDDRIAAAFAQELGRGTVSLDTRLRLTQALAELRGPVTHDLLLTLADDPDRRVALTAMAVARTAAPTAARARRTRRWGASPDEPK